MGYDILVSVKRSSKPKYKFVAKLSLKQIKEWISINSYNEKN